MIAGVCGGLGRHLDVDPVVFRILFAVLTFIGGFGLLAYAAAWLFVPDDGDDESEAHRLLTGRSALGAVAVGVLVVLGFMVAITMASRGLDHAAPLLIVAAAIITALIWRGDTTRAGAAGSAQFTAPGQEPAAENGLGAGAGAGAVAGASARPWWQRPVPGYPAAGTAAAAPSAATAKATAPAAAEGAGGQGDAPADAPPLYGAADPGIGDPGLPPPGTAAAGAYTAAYPRPRPAFQRRVNGLTISGAMLVLGLLGVVAEAGAIHLGRISGLAVALMAVGAGMVAGGLFGRARALIPLGLVLAVPLILANAIGVPLRGETGDTSWAPASAAALRSPYNLAAGRAVLDLTAIDPHGGTVQVTAYVGAGRLTVTVPDDVAVNVTSHVGAGRMTFTDGSTHAGIDVTAGFESPAVGDPHGTIMLNLRTGVGEVDVNRVD